MWTRKHDGTVLWSDAAKLKLVGLMKRNPDTVNGDRSGSKKSNAWNNVYDGLIRAGMPRTSIVRVKKCWSRIHLAAKAKYTEQLRKYKRDGRLVPLSQLNQTVINLLNDINSNSNFFVMPKPITVKLEPIDTLEETAPPAQQSMYNCDMNPVVTLERIDADDYNVKTDPTTENTPNGLSTKYWNLMEKIAEERMEREREIHQKNMILLDLKIRVQQMQIDALQG
ncbi:uncharacterized protein LOC129568666 [Sitodiplosis mosellana]|uniref:uncharacterized protein LOC129568666 n=1 Tax=Sitodiplosis mosellana TaxID=263140 RepID=UPI002443C5A2|nr:uncharacterized protein LOC129568666 [Sitodiplosis mosellana]